MSSGNRSVLIALYERAEPEDILNLQSLEAQRTAEMMRWLVGQKITGGFHSYPGLVEAYSPGDDATPPTDEVAHQCLSGLLPRPEPATYLKVDPGAAAFYQPARAGLTADDSPWIFGFSPGLNDPSQLTFLANAGPGIRWDIVECQAGPDTVESTDSRQIYDPVANTFSPLVVNKIQHSLFTFRIRRGTQGAGIPPIDLNWMPLCAVHVRTDATGFMDSDLYDIRPLTAERVAWSQRHPIAAPSSGSVARVILEEAEFSGSTAGGVNGMLLNGYFRSQFGGYWSGGDIRRNTAANGLPDFNNQGVTGADVAAFNFEDADVRSGGFAFTANKVITLGCFFPRGYPRWVRYSQPVLPSNGTTRLRIAGRRQPQGCRGILTVIDGPDGGGAINKSGVIGPVPLPATMGETQNAWGHVVCYAVVGGTNNVLPPQGSASDQRYRWPLVDVNYAGAFAPGPTFLDLAILNGAAWVTDALGSPKGATTAVVTVTPGNPGVPANAAAVLVDVRFSIVLHDTKHISNMTFVAEWAGIGQTLEESFDYAENDSGGDVTVIVDKRFWLPLRPNVTYDGIAAQTPTKLGLFISGNAAAFDTPTAMSIHFLGYAF